MDNLIQMCIRCETILDSWSVKIPIGCEYLCPYCGTSWHAAHDKNLYMWYKGKWSTEEEVKNGAKE